jgi:hypothetical protein
MRYANRLNSIMLQFGEKCACPCRLKHRRLAGHSDADRSPP